MSKDNIHIPSVIFAILITAFIIVMMWQNKPEQKMPEAKAISPPCFKEGKKGWSHKLYPTEHNVWHYILFKTEIIFPEIVYTQCIMETGLNSWCVKENNNLLCMRLPNERPTTADSENKGYAVYDSWQSCLDDYDLFQKYCFTGATEADYYTFLETYGDSNYVNNLRNSKVNFPK